MTEQIPSINIEQAIACDDIRQETSGKFILIGVYGGNLGLPVFPSQIALGFWMLARPSSKGDYDVQFRVQVPGEMQGVFGKMVVHIQEDETTALAISPMPIPLSQPGEISLQYREGSGDWKTVCSLEARLVPAAAPTD
jgi:hypothetical protein